MSSAAGRVARRGLPPAVFGAVLWWRGHQLAAVLVVAVGLAAVVVPPLGDRIEAITRRVATTLASALGTAIAAVGWLAVVLPVWALSRLVGYSPIETGWSTQRSAWSSADLGGRRDPIGAIAGASRAGSPDAGPAPGTRRRRMLRTALVLAAVAAVVGALWIRRDGSSTGTTPSVATIDLRDGARPTTFAGFPIDDYAHEDEPFSADLFRELIAANGALRPDPVVGTRNADFDGEMVNVVDGRRVTYTPDDPTLEVWFFGGSTMFGIGQRDDHTIPSVIARLAEDDGLRIRATNFGVSGDVNWQETIRFAEALDDPDLPRPDLVVFYDGWNDESLGQYRAEIGSLDPSVSERLPFSDLDRVREPVILGGRDRMEPGDEATALAIPLSAAQYARGVRTAEELAAPDDLEVLHFWQPIAAVKEYSAADDELLERTGLRAEWRAQRVAEYGAIRARSGVDPIDLSTSLDRVERPVYFDQGHTNELGAEVVASAMYEQLRPALRGASPPG